MANPKSQQFEIIKNGPLCLDKYCADIAPLGEGFNKKNSPLIGGAISNVFSKENNNINQYVSNGNHEAWLGTDNYIYIDGKKTQRFINTNENYRFVVEPIEGIDDTYLDYWNENTYLRLKNNRQTLSYKLTSGSEYNIDYIASNTYKIIERWDGKKYLVIAGYVIINGNRSSVSIKIKDENNNEVFSNSDLLNYNVPGGPYNIIPLEYNNIIIRFGRFINSEESLLLVYLVNDKNELFTSYEEDSGPSITSIGYVYFSPILGFKRAIATVSYQLPIGYVDYKGNVNFAGIRGEEYTESGTVKEKIIFCYDKAANVVSYSDITGIVTIRFIPSSADKGNFVISDLVARNIKSYACLYTNPFTDNIPGIRALFIPESGNTGFIFCKDIEGAAVYEYDKLESGNAFSSALVGDLVDDDYPLPKPVFNKRVIIGTLHSDSADYSCYEVLVDKNNMIQSFSFTRGRHIYSGSYTCNNLGTLLVPMGSVSNERPFHYIVGSESAWFLNKYIVYFDAYDKIWKKIHIENGVDLSLVDDYVLLNTTSTYNAININNMSSQIWANDWNNRFVMCNGRFSPRTGVSFFDIDIYGYVTIDTFLSNKKEIKLASAYNYYKESNNIPSSQLPEETVYLYITDYLGVDVDPEETYYYSLESMGSGCDIYDLEIYKNGIYSNSIYNNYSIGSESITSKSFIDYELLNTDYLVDSIYFTPSITMKFWETYSNKNLVDFDNLTYSLLYYGDIRKEKLIYALGTQYYGMEDIFIIQGQRYFVQNNKIYSFTVSQDNEIIENVVFITNIQGLKFKANTTKEAYFWSKNDSSLYIFTADNTLRKFYTATDVVDIYSAIYYPSLDAVVFCTNIGLLCINNNFGMFCIDNNTSGKLYLNPNGYITLFSDKLYYYNLWFLDDSWTKNNIKLSTKFYGLGSNLISITDTWYLRLFADKSLYEQMNLNRAGKLELSIDVLTDQGLSTEKRTIDIKESDWDELTDTLYIRYQPKLQRGVGISLNIDSPFAIGYLGLGNIAETIQMSRPSMQV